LPELRNVLIETENEGKNLFKVDTGIWIEKMLTEVPPPPQPSTLPMDPSVPPPPAGTPSTSITNIPAITNIILMVRGVDMTKSDPSGNPKMAYSFLSKLHLRTNLFDTNGTVFRGTLVSDTNSFTTEVNIRLKKPLLL
jgi:hypothetical protein